jgi:hypothetical protein
MLSWLTIGDSNSSGKWHAFDDLSPDGQLNRYEVSQVLWLIPAASLTRRTQIFPWHLSAPLAPWTNGDQRHPEIVVDVDLHIFETILGCLISGGWDRERTILSTLIVFPSCHRQFKFIFSSWSPGAQLFYSGVARLAGTVALAALGRPKLWHAVNGGVSRIFIGPKWSPKI